MWIHKGEILFAISAALWFAVIKDSSPHGPVQSVFELHLLTAESTEGGDICYNVISCSPYTYLHI